MRTGARGCQVSAEGNRLGGLWGKGGSSAPKPEVVGLIPVWLVVITQLQGHGIDSLALILAFCYPPKRLITKPSPGFAKEELPFISTHSAPGSLPLLFLHHFINLQSDHRMELQY